MHLLLVTCMRSGTAEVSDAEKSEGLSSPISNLTRIAVACCTLEQRPKESSTRSSYVHDSKILLRKLRSVLCAKCSLCEVL
jgi:hypothetical protein